MDILLSARAPLKEVTLPSALISSKTLINPFTYLLACLSAINIFSGVRIWSKRSKEGKSATESGNETRLRALKDLKHSHETASSLSELIELDGAGTWPPKANHSSWPEALRPYKDIYLELVPLLPAAKPSLDDNVNHKRREKYRSSMRKLFAERVNVVEVEKLMAQVEAGKWDQLSRDAYNGFYSCVAVCRHAYR